MWFLSNEKLVLPFFWAVLPFAEHAIANRVSLLLSRTGLVVSREFRRELGFSRIVPCKTKILCPAYDYTRKEDLSKGFNLE